MVLNNVVGCGYEERLIAIPRHHLHAEFAGDRHQVILHPSEQAQRTGEDTTRFIAYYDHFGQREAARYEIVSMALRS